MTAAASRSSEEESGPTPLEAFLEAHPGAVRTIAIGAGIGASLGLGVGLGLPGRGASYRVAVTLLVVLGFALAGALIAAGNALPSSGQGRRWLSFDTTWVEDKLTEGASPPTPRRVSGSRKESSG